MMKVYGNLGGNSGIIAYENGIDSIKIEFKEGENTTYLYTNSVAGKAHIDKMKSLAESGSGLNSYISINKPDWSTRSPRFAVGKITI